MSETNQTEWLEGFPQGVDPDAHVPGECPWHKFDASDHTDWAHRVDDVLVLRSHGVAKTVLGDRRFKQGMHARIARQAPGLDPRFIERRRDALLGREGPDHIRLRRIASKAAFTPNAANRHRPLMQQVMTDLVDKIPCDGVCDIVELVHDYPSRVIARVLGSEEHEVTSFAELIETIFDAQRGVPAAVPLAWEAIQQLDGLLENLIERKRDTPGADLISDLIRAQTEEGKLSTNEVHDIAVAVVMAGTETTRNVLIRGLQLLAEHPHLWEALANEDLLAAAAEEILRFAPLAPMRRVASEDLAVHDITVPQGALLVIDIGTANRDPAVVDDPDVFRLDREGASQHLSLSHGHKYCLGANLAKAEMVEALRVLRRRFDHLELVGSPVWTSKGLPRGKQIMMRFANTT